ncbi:MAG: hypothetical protein ACYTJ0_02600 [Planctomycetota bacterium]|jgi:hypothetical protein
MGSTLARLKPGGPRHMHLLLAAVTWTAVGTGLLIAGVRWSRFAAPTEVLVAGAAIVVGAAKAWFVLRGAAGRVAARIESRGDHRCVGGFLSWRTWLFVLAMSVAGRMLRRLGLPSAIVGFIYLAVGSALLMASWWLWSAWRTARRRTSEPDVA